MQVRAGGFNPDRQQNVRQPGETCQRHQEQHAVAAQPAQERCGGRPAQAAQVDPGSRRTNGRKVGAEGLPGARAASQLSP